MNRNPLPNHGGPKVNAMENDQEMQVKRDIRDVRMAMRLVYEALVKADRVKAKKGKEEEEDQVKHHCQYHDKMVDHPIQECMNFLKLIQEMMNRGEMEFYRQMEEQKVNVLIKEAPKPLTIFYRGGGQQATKEQSDVMELHKSNINTRTSDNRRTKARKIS